VPPQANTLRIDIGLCAEEPNGGYHVLALAAHRDPLTGIPSEAPMHR